MFAATLAFLLVTPGTDLDKKITFTSVAKPAKKLLAEMTAIIGFPLETSPETAEEVFVVHFSDVPVGEVMKRIATAADGEWRKEESCYRLIRPAEEVAKK